MSPSARRRRLAAGAAVGCLALVLTGCAGQEDSSAEGSAAQSSAPSSAAAEGSAASSASQTVPAEQQEHVQEAIEQGYALNAEGADLPVVTMFTDYECPACRSYHPAVEQAAEALDGEVTVRVKNFPLPMHDNARPAALAVEAAALQDKGHDYADAVYAEEDWIELSDQELTDRLVELAGEAGLDQDRFRADLGSAAVAQIVDAHQAQAEELGLRGTPSFLAGDVEIDLGDVRTPEDLREAFQDAAASETGQAQDA